MKKTMISLFMAALLLAGASFASTGIHSNHKSRLRNLPASAQQVQQKVDINSANAEQLQTLKGIGPKKAQAIVNYRKNNGSFKSISDLNKVKGVGAKYIARLQAKNPGRLVAKH